MQRVKYITSSYKIYTTKKYIECFKKANIFPFYLLKVQPENAGQIQLNATEDDLWEVDWSNAVFSGVYVCMYVCWIESKTSI